MPLRLVINADDLGYNSERDRAIFECFEDGSSVSSTSVLANGFTGEGALLHAKQIGLPVGLHFNITEGKPLTSAQKLPSITEDGLFLGKIAFTEKARSGTINRDEVALELKEQIKWFRGVCGSLPSHVDGHQHVHVMPQIQDPFSDVLEKSGIKWTRLPNENCGTEECSNFLQYVLSNCAKAAETFSTHHISFSDAFVGLSVMGSQMTVQRVTNALQRIDTDLNCDIVSELMVHPGYMCQGEGGCGAGPDEFSKSQDREHEMKILRSVEFKRALEKGNIKITSFEDILKECIDTLP